MTSVEERERWATLYEVWYDCRREQAIDARDLRRLGGRRRAVVPGKPGRERGHAGHGPILLVADLPGESVAVEGSVWLRGLTDVSPRPDDRRAVHRRR